MTGLTPPRIDQVNRPGPPRVISPGSPNVIRAHLVIISGASGSGEFIYLGTPGPGTLVISSAAQAGTDSFGNAYPAYIGLFGPGGVLLRNITPTADLIYTPTGGEGNLSVALASFPGVDTFGNAYLQGLTALAGQLSGQTLTASVLEGLNFRVDEHGVFIYQPPTPPTIVLTSANIITPSVPYLIGTVVSTLSNLVIPVATGTAATDYIYVSADSALTGPVVTGVTDSKGNTYTQRTQVGTNIPTAVWTSPGGTALVAGVDTITVTFAAGTQNKDAMAVGVPNLPAAAVDNVPAGTTGSSTTPSITSGALAQANEVVLATIGNANGGGAPAWAAGWNVVNTLHTGSNAYLSVAYQNVSSASPVTASATIVSANWNMGMVTFKESASVQTTTQLIPAPTPLVLAQPPLPYQVGGLAQAAGSNTTVVSVGSAGGQGTTAGDVIHVAASSATGTATPTSISDSKGNAYTPRNGGTAVGAPTLQTWDAGAAGTPTVALVAGVDTITILWSGTTGDKEVSVTGIPNLPASSADTGGGASLINNVGTNPTVAAVTQQFTEIGIVSLAWNNAGGALKWDVPDQPIDQQHTGTGVFLAKAWQGISQPPSQIQASPTIAVSTNASLAIDCYREA